MSLSLDHSDLSSHGPIVLRPHSLVVSWSRGLVDSGSIWDSCLLGLLDS
jgi:hypothetical protein